MPKTAGIILIGNEILSGKIEDANAAYLCRELRGLGVDVRRITVIPDEVDLIAEEVAAFSARLRRRVHVRRRRADARRRDHRGRGARDGRARRAPSRARRAARALLPRHGSPRRRSAWPRCRRAPSWSPAASLRFPTILMRNVYVLPGVPEIFRQKFDALRERFRDQPIHLKNVFVAHRRGHAGRPPERAARVDFPLLLLGSYPEFSNPEYKVKVTLESRDRGYLEQALAASSWRGCRRTLSSR